VKTPPLGKAADRVEAADKLTGRAKYAAEFTAPNMAHAVVVTSGIAAGRDGLQYKRGDAAAALKVAAFSVEVTYSTPVQHHHPLEPCAALTEWSGEALTLHVSSRNVNGVKAVAAGVFGLPPDKVCVVCPVVGGAFGSKGFTWQHDLLAAAAKAVGRPVRLVLTRRQMAVLAGHRPETRQTVGVAADQGGKLVALRHAATSTTSPVAEFAEACGEMTKRLYSCGNVDVSHTLLTVNRSSPVFMRAPGETPGLFAFE